VGENLNKIKIISVSQVINGWAKSITAVGIVRSAIIIICVSYELLYDNIFYYE